MSDNATVPYAQPHFADRDIAAPLPPTSIVSRVLLRLANLFPRDIHLTRFASVLLTCLAHLLGGLLDLRRPLSDLLGRPFLLSLFRAAAREDTRQGYRQIQSTPHTPPPAAAHSTSHLRSRAVQAIRVIPV